MKARIPFTSSSSPPLLLPVTVPSTTWPTLRLSHDTLVACEPLRFKNEQAFPLIVAIDIKIVFFANLWLGFELKHRHHALALSAEIDEGIVLADGNNSSAPAAFHAAGQRPPVAWGPHDPSRKDRLTASRQCRVDLLIQR